MCLKKSRLRICNKLIITICIIGIIISNYSLYNINVKNASDLYKIANTVGINTNRYNLFTRKGFITADIINRLDYNTIESGTITLNSDDIYQKYIILCAHDLTDDNIFNISSYIENNYPDDTYSCIIYSLETGIDIGKAAVSIQAEYEQKQRNDFIIEIIDIIILLISFGYLFYSLFAFVKKFIIKLMHKKKPA